MAPHIATAGEHSGRPPPRPSTNAPTDGLLGSYLAAICTTHLRLAAVPTNGGVTVPAHGRIELRRAQWSAAATAAIIGLVAYVLWAATDYGEALGEVAAPSEPAVYALVVSPPFDPPDLAETEPAEVALLPPDSRAKAREALARQLAREMDAIANRHALLTRHRAAISRSLIANNPEPWSALELQAELERLTAGGV